MNTAYWFSTPDETEQVLKKGLRSSMGIVVLYPNIDEAIMDGLDYSHAIVEVDLDALPLGAMKTGIQLANEGKMLDVRGHGQKLFCTRAIPASALSAFTSYIGSTPRM